LRTLAPQRLAAARRQDAALRVGAELGGVLAPVGGLPGSACGHVPNPLRPTSGSYPGSAPGRTGRLAGARAAPRAARAGRAARAVRRGGAGCFVQVEAAQVGAEGAAEVGAAQGELDRRLEEAELVTRVVALPGEA